MTGMGALQSAPQLRERLLRRIGSWSWNDEVGSKAEVQKRRAPAAICLSPAAIEFPGKERGKALSV